MRWSSLCHRILCVTEYAGPFTEGQVGCDEDGCAFVKFTNQVEQELSASLGDGKTTQFIQDQEVEAGDEVGGSPLPFGTSLGVKLIHKIDHVEEPAVSPGPDAGSGAADGEMGFAGEQPDLIGPR